MRNVTGLLGLVCAIAITGCPTDPTDNNDPAKLVGEWREVLPAGDVDPPTTLSINADGTYLLDEESGPEAGTYSANTQTITIAADGSETELSYVLRGDQLLVGALLPEGAVVGFVGEWHGEIREDEELRTVDLSIRGDGTMHYDQSATDEDPRLELDGTWREDGTALVTALTVLGPSGPVSIDIRWNALGNAIGNPLFARVR